MNENNERIIETKGNLKNGQQFCPNCGATETYFDTSIGKLFCPYCETIFEGEKIEESKTGTLEGTIIGSGAQKINEDFNNIVTIRCNGCGAEVVVDTSETTQKRCHWCRGILSINERLENGAVPDKILPFKITKEEAQQEIEKFLKKRRFYASLSFKKNYNTNNIMGVYLPYMLVDVNASCDFEGIGETKTNTYWVRFEQKPRYDVDVYKIRKQFNITIEDLTLETKKDKLDKTKKDKTNNIINSIMPFDTENCIRFESRYLRGFTSEKRDINIEDIKEKVELQTRDITRHALLKYLKHFDRGVRWEKEKINIIGTRWVTAYLPVWLYSYYDKNTKKQHYIAVNGRTKEMTGSVPINIILFYSLTGIIEIYAIIISLYLLHTVVDVHSLIISFILLIIGPIFYKIVIQKYRNKNKRHTYEKETKTNITKLIDDISVVDHKHGVKKDCIEKQNATKIEAEKIKKSNNFIK